MSRTTLSPLSFGRVIQKYRTINEMSQPELAEFLGTSRNTITNWENDKSMPTASAIKEMVRLLGIPLYELFGLSNEDHPTGRERVLLRQYRQLSPSSQNFAVKMVGSLLQEEQDAEDRRLRDSFVLLPLETTPAAAGTGCAFVDVAPDYCFIKKNRYSETADALVRVSGASMEPLYHSDDLVYIKYGSSADDGQDVVCATADGAVIKRMQNRKLFSLNKDFPFGEKSEDDHVVILGIVLGVVAYDDLATEEECKELEEVKYKEVMKFHKQHGEE